MTIRNSLTNKLAAKEDPIHLSNSGLLLQLRDVRFPPKSGHCERRGRCPLMTQSGPRTAQQMRTPLARAAVIRMSKLAVTTQD